jgi:cytochrome c6
MIMPRVALFRVAAVACIRAGCLASLIGGCSKEVPAKPASVMTPPAADMSASEGDGEALFKQFCASCHPNGGNVSDPKRTLYRSVLQNNHINTPEDVVRVMRNPLWRMIRFDVSTLSDTDARAIADYILKTFK